MAKKNNFNRQHVGALRTYLTTQNIATNNVKESKYAFQRRKALILVNTNSRPATWLKRACENSRGDKDIIYTSNTIPLHLNGSDGSYMLLNTSKKAELLNKIIANRNNCPTLFNHLLCPDEHYSN